jgi:GNAT superfamily N-acetyltransferase
VPEVAGRLRNIYCRSACFFVDNTIAPSLESVDLLRWMRDGTNSLLVYEGGRSLRAALDWVAESGARAEILVAEGALGHVQVLADAGWVCIDVHPLMRRPVMRGEPTLEGRPPVGESFDELTDEEELAEAIEVMSEAFGAIGDIPRMPTSGSVPGSTPRAWGLRQGSELVACALTVRVDDTVVLSAVATRPTRQQHGYGRRLLAAVHREFPPQSGAREFLLSSSERGRHLYQSSGYRTVDWWQAWSRPRWALGRA